MTLTTKFRAYEIRASLNPLAHPCLLHTASTKRIMLNHRLLIGTGLANVSPAVWFYEVSGKRVLAQWFSYRKKNRERPIIGDRRPPSKLGDIQPDQWLAEYTTELLNVLNVLAWLVTLEPQQEKLLEAICEGPTCEF